MAIKWSTWGNVGMPGGYRGRSQVEVTHSPTTITAATTSVTVTVRGRLAMEAFSNGSNLRWELRGTQTASAEGVSWNVASAGATATPNPLFTRTFTVPLVYGQTQVFNAGVRVRPAGSWAGGGSGSFTPWADLAYTIPARPISKPAAPTLEQPAWTSDTRQTIAWSVSSPSSAPVTSQRVKRSTNGATPITIATLTGSPRSYIDTSTVAGNRYTYSIEAVNSAGSTASAAAVSISTTPTRPGAPTAARAGIDINVTRGALSSSATHWRAWDSEDGAAPVLVSGLIAAATGTWVHPAPDPAVTHTYYVEAVSSQPTLYSVLSPASAPVQLIAPPLAPTPLGPAAADATEDITLLYAHNPVDTTGQRKREVETRATSGDPWVSEGIETTTEQALTIDADTWPNGTSRRWRARTWGEATTGGSDGTGASPWSEEQILPLTGRPAVEITSPGASWPSQVMTVEWTFFDPEGSAQASWQARLVSGDAVVESISGTQPSTRSASFATPVDNGADYTVQVRASDGHGLMSEWDEVTTGVDYAPPATPSLTVTWHKDDGYTSLSVSAGHDGDVETEHVRLERATPAGWVTVPGAEEIDVEDLPTTITDLLPPLGQMVTYRAVAVSELASEAYSPEETVHTRTKWVFLNHGPGFAQLVRVYGNLNASMSYSRAKALQQLRGRKLPIERGGESVTRTYSLTATLFGPDLPPDLTSTWAEVEALADALAPVCVRDPEGTRLFCSVGDVPLSDHLRPHRNVTIPLTVVDWPSEGAA